MRRDDDGRVVPPPLYTVLVITAAAVGERFLPLPMGMPRFEVSLAAGLCVFTAAAALAAWAIVVMARHRTTVEPGQVPAHLVTSGPFRFTRNPIYVALVTMTIAVGVVFNSAWQLGAAALLVLLLDRLVIVREEAVIRRTFGDQYADYCRRVRRWL